MQLEKIIYRPTQKQRTIPERQRVYTIVDLEYLSAGVLYGLLSSDPLGQCNSSPLGFSSGSIFDRMDDFVKLSRPLEIESIPLRLKCGPRGFKIFDESKGGAPLIRLDYLPHGSKPPMHIQYGESHEDSGRSGKEAAELLAKILELNKKIKFPGINDSDES